jgi:hypothetical protein
MPGKKNKWVIKISIAKQIYNKRLIPLILEIQHMLRTLVGVWRGSKQSGENQEKIILSMKHHY